MRKLLTILSLLFVLFGNSQTTPPAHFINDDFKVGTGTAPTDFRPGLTYLPPGYDTSHINYPVIFYWHGIGEASNTRNNNTLTQAALPKLIKNGMVVRAKNPVDGKWYDFIVFVPQHPYGGWGQDFTAVQFKRIFDDLKTRYRIDTTRVYNTGISIGAQSSISQVTWSETEAKKIAATVPVSVTGLGMWQQESDSVVSIGTRYGVRLWTIVGSNDVNVNGTGVNPVAISQLLVDRYNTNNPNPLGIRTVVSGGGHDAVTWDQAYDTTWRTNGNNTAVGKNIYEWMLQYQSNVSPVVPVNIVVLGSSTAAGLGASTFDSSWVGRLQLYYRKNINDGLDTVVTDLAVQGTTTHIALPTGTTVLPGRATPDPEHNTTKAKTYNPKLVFVNFPSNDVGAGYPEAEFMNNLRLIYHDLLSTGARVFVTTTQPRNSYTTSQRAQLKELVDSINAQFWDKSIDFWTPIVTIDGLNNIDPLYNADNTHPNDAGHLLLFNQVLARPLWKDVHDTSKITTITVTFATPPTWNSTHVEYAKMKYNKYGFFNLTQDDRGNSVFDMSSYEYGGIAPFNGILYPGIPMTDGATVRRKYIFGSGSIAWNSFANTDTTVDWTANGSPGVFMTVDQVSQCVKRNWGVLDHGGFHGKDLAGAVALGLTAQTNAAINRSYAYRKLAAAGTPYVMRFGVVPSNDPDYMSAWEQMGYLGGTSENQFDNYNANPAAEFINAGVANVTNYIKSTQHPFVQARGFKDLNASDAPLFYKITTDSIIHQSTDANRTAYSVGIHFPDFNFFRSMYDSLIIRGNDHLWIGDLHEFYEYFDVAHTTKLTWVLTGNVLTITLDGRFVNPDARWLDKSIIVTSDATITNVTATGGDDYSFNPGTGLINIYQKKTEGFKVPPYYTELPFVKGYVPLQADDHFIDNNYEVNADALFDGDTTVTVQLRPSDGAMIHTPYEVTIALDDYGPIPDTVYVHGNNTSGFIDSLFLARNDNNQRYFIGIFTGGTGWQKFPIADRFVADRLIQSSNSTSGFGSEIKLHAVSYFPYTEQTFKHKPIPLKNEIGFDIHWWDVGRNGVDSFNAIWPEKLKVIDSVGAGSLRFFQSSEFYQNASGSQWAFNPNTLGFFEDIIFRALKQNNQGIFIFGSVLDQSKAIQASWTTRDATIQLRGTVVSYDDALGYGRLTIRYTASTGAGKTWDKWWIDPVTGSAVPQSSVGFAIIPSAFPVTGTLNVSAGINYHAGDSVIVSARHVSEVNILYPNNSPSGRTTLSTYDSVANQGYRFGARRGTNPFASPHNPLRDPFLVDNDNHVGLGNQSAIEVGKRMECVVGRI
jgi:lysophospholipase L1-like esterase